LGWLRRDSFGSQTQTRPGRGGASRACLAFVGARLARPPLDAPPLGISLLTVIVRTRSSSTPAWTLLSSFAAPCFLLAGCIAGALRQPASFDSSIDTISVLAAIGAPDRWIMTTALVLLGACHVITASGLRAASSLGRAVLALGGVATLLVAVFPLPREGGSFAHFIVATATFALLAAWPLCALRLGGEAPRCFRPPLAIGATLALSLSVGWLLWTLSHAPRIVGLAERVVALAEAVWPLVAVLLTRLDDASMVRAAGPRGPSASA